MPQGELLGSHTHSALQVSPIYAPDGYAKECLLTYDVKPPRRPHTAEYAGMDFGDI